MASSELVVESFQLKCIPRSPWLAQSHISSVARCPLLRCCGRPGHDGGLPLIADTPIQGNSLIADTPIQ